MSEFEALPEDFDVVVLGTGLPESILAAACARLGYTVLHLDRNEFYGGNWASFNFDGLKQWLNIIKSQNSEKCLRNQPSVELAPNEFSIELLKNCNSCIENVEEKWENSSSDGDFLFQKSEESPNVDNEEKPKAGDDKTQNLGNHESSNVDSRGSPNVDNDESSNVDSCGSPNADNDQSPNKGNHETPTAGNRELSASNQVWSKSKIFEEWRRFSFDLSPKLLLGRGSMVDLLVTSNVARYAEFKSVGRILTCNEKKIKEVPCSRADIFQSQEVSMVDKRVLMKFLSYCLNYNEEKEPLEDPSGKSISESEGETSRKPGTESGGETSRKSGTESGGEPSRKPGTEFGARPSGELGAEGSEISFVDFLSSQKLSKSLQHYITNALAMVPKNATRHEGILAVKKFVMSTGRYGNSPFLFPIYGCGELPQCFCRLCAVFGGTYYLNRGADSIICSEKRCVGIVSGGQRISCRNLIAERSYFSLENCKISHRESRAILLTNGSLLPAAKDHISLFNHQPQNLQHPVRILEVGSSALVCPKDLFLVYMFADSESKTAHDDLWPMIEEFFSLPSKNENSASDSKKPQLLWALFYNQSEFVKPDFQFENLLVTQTFDASIDYDSVVHETKKMFKSLWPDDEFLPMAPNPEDLPYLEQQDYGVNGYTPEPENMVPRPGASSTEPATNDDSKSQNEEKSENSVEEGEKPKNEHATVNNFL